MQPIWITEREGSKGYLSDEFSSRFREIIEESDRPLSAMVYCDLEHPHVWPVLQEPQYWTALNRITGELLRIYYLHFPKSSAPWTTGTVDVSEELDMVRDHIGESKMGNVPHVVFFHPADAGRFDHHEVRITGDNAEEVFRDLENLFNEATASISKSVAAGRNDPKDLLDGLVKDLLVSRWKKRLSKMAPTVAKALVSLFGKAAAGALA
ncbi:MAG: hypothetical protein JSW58_12085 [Candidatus Latescibacterota bacterium]|nr:MAG: hypothetical protein JSW58_12085 [Candidatus Latescibacterota bacterium]